MLFKKLTKSEIEFLLYLQHDKSHVMGNDRKNPTMARIFSKIPKKKITKPLYRGIYPKEIALFSAPKNSSSIIKAKNNLPQNEIVLKRYSSFSENISIAKSFAGSSKIIIKLVSSNSGLNYAQFIVDYMNDLKRKDRDTYEQEDGDFLIDEAKKEAEWIFNLGASIRMLSSKNIGGFEIISYEETN
jgi:hypothetical protein